MPGETSAAQTAADAPPPAVEDYTYPNADQVLTEHGLKVFRGDGRIVLDSSRTYEEDGQCPVGQIQVEKALAEAPYGIYYCFRTWGARGFLTLEVPGTFGLRGGDKPLQAKANLPDGESRTYEVDANEFVAVEPGTGTELPQAILVELRLPPTS
ncbi:hypothetical protein FAF44_41800 [Nonomuraea sp. MG754425]|uniref:hypothetical protein n=1 Tax=Nonomuraea sp. MG754425 TaxID=2570319 RepID=UPI001F39E034|nr:hypothetical protein [Nonomuraea sp. MG754425]MCF6474866.1 hypothetical protein [Nonomuraea sp. MG754425]